MTNEKPHIRIGHFPDFEGKEILLISSDIKGLLELEEVFWQLSNGLAEYNFSNLKLLDKKFRVNLSAFNGSSDIGLIKKSIDSYEWTLTKEKWDQFRERLTGLYRIGTDGNRPLNIDRTDEQEIDVFFSWNEYPLAFWGKTSRISTPYNNRFKLSLGRSANTRI